jgi:dienelactone hydrolase
MAQVTVERDLPYANDSTRLMDVYRPEASASDCRPAVVLATGFPESGAAGHGLPGFRDWASYQDWARLIACSGLTAITYTNEEPRRDLDALLDYIAANGKSLGIDASRVGLWACSGNAPTALAAIGNRTDIACAVLSYGYLMDLPGEEEVATAAAKFGFVNATAGMSIDHFRRAPLMIVRAGADEMPGLNTSMDRFVSDALDANLPGQLLDFPEGIHGFDVFDATERSKQFVMEQIRYLLANLA